MQKKHVYLFFTSLLLSIFAVGPVFATGGGGCECNLLVEGPGCNVNKTELYPFDSTVSPALIISSIPSEECSSAVKSIAGNYIDDTPFSVSAEACNAFDFEGEVDAFLVSYVYSLQCKTVGGGDASGPGGNCLCIVGEGENDISESDQPNEAACLANEDQLAGIVCDFEPYSTASSTEGASQGGFIVPKNIKDLNKIGTDSFATFLGRFAGILLTVAGSVALVFIIVGGTMTMTSAGSSDRWVKGIKVAAWTGIGLMVILASYAIVRFLLNAFA